MISAAMTVVLGSMAPAVLAADPTVSTPGLGQAPAGGLYIDTRFTPVKTAADVVYGQSVNVNGVLQEHRLDVWEPTGHDDEQFRPAVVWVHGGAFTQGNKTILEFALSLVERGYVVVSINYRLRPDLPCCVTDYVTRPEALAEGFAAAADAAEDAKAAVRWVRAHAAEYRIDPGRVVAAGGSAGAATSLGVAFNSDDPGGSGNGGWDSHVSAALSRAGSYVTGVQGGPILPGDPPILLFHGTHDTTVPMAASAAPCANTIAVGNVCEMHVWAGDGHGLASHRPEMATMSADFLHRHVIQAERISTAFEDVATTVRGETVGVTARLVTEQGDPVAGARVLSRATAGWVEAKTAGDGSFAIEVHAPDHGRATDILLRYEGFHPNRPSLPTTPTPLAPAHTTTTATWGSGQ